MRDVDQRYMMVSSSTTENVLCEILTKEAIRPELALEDVNFRFHVFELEAMLPARTVDRVLHFA